MTFYHESGKGSHKRKEDLKAIESNWDKIDWSCKSERTNEEKLEIFNKNKMSNFVASTKLEQACKVCHGEGGCFDGGFWYECNSCK